MSNTVSLNVLNRRHWEQPLKSEPLGCSSCIDRAICGGIRPETDVFSCRDYCCGKPADCSRICDRRPVDFVNRQREVGGWSLDTIPRFKPAKSPDVPAVIPELFHNSGRHDALRTPAVAVPLKAILNRSASKFRYAKRADLLAACRVSERAALVIDGIGRDRFIENFWEKHLTSGLINGLAALKPAWVVVPNYSVITNVPRWENLHAMKRIALVWSELTKLQVPAALTLNARTDHDWRRWTEFVIARPEVLAVAVELGTGARYTERRAVMLDHLQSLGKATDGRLRLFLRGGRKYVQELSGYFCSVHLLDTNSFMKAVHRQRVVATGDGVSSKPSFTLVGQPIEDLLGANVRTSQRHPHHRVSSGS